MYRHLSLVFFLVFLTLISYSCKKTQVGTSIPEPEPVTKDYREKYIGEYTGSLWNSNSYLVQIQFDTTQHDLTFRVRYNIKDSVNYYGRNELLYTLPGLQIIVTDKKGDTLTSHNNGYWGVDTNGKLIPQHNDYGYGTYTHTGGFQTNDSLVFVGFYWDAKTSSHLTIRAKKK